ncbi:MAG: hypothetical protein AVDCRST_MAG39-1402 [uncultured Sphingomonadaceae bacterium]|uniref:Uncharacterized protein n=1 Tax=uncultured Sphingomonadaceae bacterium TaxID=169976 RepID=A0A6J4SPG5_9SPHN|nr:MAG: hypothetical protein AVDCRST_MAG39-1402 [uncultured Sphingomonadaceae bacterium]
MAQDDETQAERGDLFFFYRLKIDASEPRGIDDVQRFHMVLRRADGKLFRLLTVGRKHLPDIAVHEREWGLVDLVTDEVEPIAEALRVQEYDTKTRGHRVNPAARPVGEGAYALARDRQGLHLSYRLELPAEPGEAQRALGIVAEATYRISVKNPEVANPPNIGLREGERVRYPKAMQRRDFGARRFTGSDPHLLDFERTEFILIGASDEAGGEVDAKHRAPTAESVLRRLHLPKRVTPIAPLVEGEWA